MQLQWWSNQTGAVRRISSTIEWERKAALFTTYFLLFARMPQQARTLSVFLWSNTVSDGYYGHFFYHMRVCTQLVQASTVFICRHLNCWWVQCRQQHHSTVCLTSLKWYWNIQEVAKSLACRICYKSQSSKVITKQEEEKFSKASGKQTVGFNLPVGSLKL